MTSRRYKDLSRHGDNNTQRITRSHEGVRDFVTGQESITREKREKRRKIANTAKDIIESFQNPKLVAKKVKTEKEFRLDQAKHGSTETYKILGALETKLRHNKAIDWNTIIVAAERNKDLTEALYDISQEIPDLREIGQERVQIEHQSLDAPQYPEQTRDRFGNQALTEIFPKVNLDHITDPTEKNAYQAVLCHYAQVLHDKAAQAYPEIFQHYQDSQIYYKWYGASKELKQMVAIYDEHDEKFLVGPSKGIFLSRFGIDVHQNSNVYKNKNMQDVLKHLQSRKSVEWATYDVSKPLYKKKEEYEYNEVKQGPRGLYVTDNYIHLAQDFGGHRSTMIALYNETNPQKTAGPWILPEGAVQKQPQFRGSHKPKYGDVFKLETPEEPS